MAGTNRWHFLCNPLLVSAALAILTSTAAMAQGKGGGDGGGGDKTGGGTIYYYSTEPEPDAVVSMNPDGSQKTLLSGADPEPSWWLHDASRELHGGHRWFLRMRLIPGEIYPSNNHLNERMELFAVRDDLDGAFAVQLTDDPTLQAMEPSRWMPGDSAISFIGRRWEGDQVVDGGVYVAALAYDAAGNITGLQQQPADPTISLPLVAWSHPCRCYYSPFEGDPGPDLANHDWAPDGSRLVYDRVSLSQMRIITLDGQDTLLLAHSNGGPRWSPDNTKIAFNSFGNIDTINPNGSGRKTIVKWSVNGPIVHGPVWSPTGSHLIYTASDRVTLRYDIHRATSGGASKTNLTGDLPYGVLGEWYILGWR